MHQEVTQCRVNKVLAKQPRLLSTRIPLSFELSGTMVSLRPPRGYHSPQQSPRQLDEQISDLKIELARRDADVEYLEGQLAEAVAANRPRVWPHADWSPDKVSCFPLDRQQQHLC